MRTPLHDEGLPRLLAVAALLILGWVVSLRAADDDAFAAARGRMLDEIRAMSRTVATETDVPAVSERTLSVLAEVPRHRFVPPRLQDVAYENRPLPIGSGQTISQPYIVALMTDVLDCRPGDKVLEVGTGSGYQAAVLAETGARVFSIEIVPDLARSASERLDELGYDVRVRAGDGYLGWPEEAPFDRIIVTAAAPHLPPPLLAQLAPGGRMVIPTGEAGAVQGLLLVEKAPDGTLQTRTLLPVLFVPLTGRR